MAAVPDHWCRIKELENFTQLERLQLAIPKYNNTYSHCESYQVNWTQLLEENVYFQPNESWPKQKCPDGWEYNKTEITSSIVIDVGT